MLARCRHSRTASLLSAGSGGRRQLCACLARAAVRSLPPPPPLGSFAATRAAPLQRRLTVAANPPPLSDDGAKWAAPRDAIRTIFGALEEAASTCSDDFEVRLDADGTLTLDLGGKGMYSLQQVDGGRLYLFSPVSGPLYYGFDAENCWWSNPDDGHLLVELLVRELMHTTGCFINL